MTLIRLSTALLFLSSASAFVMQSKGVRPATNLFLEDHIADMIDKALYNRLHKDEYEKDWAKKNAEILETHIPAGFDFDDNFSVLADEEVISPLQIKKDRRLARNDPQRYCADRCLATGNCEIYEDFFEMSAKDVVKFCSDCVLSEDDEPCDIPEAMLEDGFDKLQP